MRNAKAPEIWENSSSKLRSQCRDREALYPFGNPSHEGVFLWLAGSVQTNVQYAQGTTLEKHPYKVETVVLPQINE